VFLPFFPLTFLSLPLPPFPIPHSPSPVFPLSFHFGLRFFFTHTALLIIAQAHHIDRTDFLNAVVREKKRFENALDDSVAGGLNAGTEVLMNQVRVPDLDPPPTRL